MLLGVVLLVAGGHALVEGASDLARLAGMSERVIGRVETPTRHVIEAAADHVTTPVIGFTSVSMRNDAGLRTHALFTGISMARPSGSISSP